VTSADDGDIRALTRLASRARSVVASVEWHTAMQRRSIRIGVALRSIAFWVIEEEVRRLKVDGGWALVSTASGATIVSIQTRVAGRTVAELAEPVHVRVHAPELVDLAELQCLEHEGLVRIVAGGQL
jgi:hypothetical protein